MNESITLTTNWFSYLFDEAILRNGQNCDEHVQQLGIISDVFYHMADSDLRKKNSEIVGFIPDKSNEISDSIGSRIGDIAGHDVAKIVANGNNANQKYIRINENFNVEFVKKQL